MKFQLVLMFLLLLSINAFASTSDNAIAASIANTYEAAGIPNFLPFVGQALPGRCYQASGSNKKLASVLMVSFEEDGFELVPYDAKGKSEDFFDKIKYEDVLKQFPIIKKMFLTVSETANGAVLEKDIGDDVYRSEIRESERYMIMRVFLNGSILKLCNYNKTKN